MRGRTSDGPARARRSYRLRWQAAYAALVDEPAKALYLLGQAIEVADGLDRAVLVEVFGQRGVALLDIGPDDADSIGKLKNAFRKGGD